MIPNTTKAHGDERGNDEGETTSKPPLFHVLSQKRKVIDAEPRPLLES